MPIAETLGYLARPAHLRRTTSIALVVGIVLSTINQLTVITAGHANTATWVRYALNFVVPFNRLQPRPAHRSTPPLVRCLGP